MSQAEVPPSSRPCCPHWILPKACSTWTARWLQQIRASLSHMTPKRKQETVALRDFSPRRLPSAFPHISMAKANLAVEPWPLEPLTRSWALSLLLWIRQSPSPHKSHRQSGERDKITASCAVRALTSGICGDKRNEENNLWSKKASW